MGCTSRTMGVSGITPSLLSLAARDSSRNSGRTPGSPDPDRFARRNIAAADLAADLDQTGIGGYEQDPFIKQGAKLRTTDADGSDRSADSVLATFLPAKPAGHRPQAALEQRHQHAVAGDDALAAAVLKRSMRKRVAGCRDIVAPSR
jgi:hypothetical protein